MQNFHRISERPFNSEQKYMAVSGKSTLDINDREQCYMKGSIESVLNRCKFYYVSDESTPALDASSRAMINAKAVEASSKGLRVIALAYGLGSVDILDDSLNPDQPASKPPANLIFVGFQCMLDPPRNGVADAISLLQSSGVHVVMITGDSEHTALSIARQLNLHIQGSSASCLTGQAIDAMTEKQLSERIGTVSVFARTTPRHKMAIVEAFRARGDVVAMTGDGGKR